MKIVLKVLLWVLIAITVGLLGSTFYFGMQDFVEKPEMEKYFDMAINYDLYWGYALFGFAFVAAIIAFLFNVVSHPSGLVKTLIGLVLAGVVVGVPVFFVWGHEVLPVPNSAGGVFDNPKELRIAEAGLFVTYIVAAITAVVVVYDICSGLVRRIIK
ncbi:MAG: hypothetical protein IIV16_01245 [Alistipes sp.]|nr:hypothetical protein [Alistipes sp.]